MFPNPEDKLKLDSKMRDWIDKGEMELNAFVADRVQPASDYIDNIQVPTGFTDQHKAQFAAANNPAATVTQKNYIVINQVIQSHETILGNFIQSKQTVNLNARSPKDVKKIIPIRKGMKYIEDHNQTFNRVAVPCIDHMLQTGLGWSKTWYDPFEDLPNGRIKEAHISERDVIVDVDSRDFFYEDTNYRIHRIRMILEDAQEEFKTVEGFDSSKLQTDMDWSAGVPQSKSGQNRGKYCTIYEVQYRRREWLFKYMKENDEAVEISEQQYKDLSEDPKHKDRVIKDRDEVYYIAYYNKTAGCFWNRRSLCFTLVPWINRRSENEVFPLGDFIYYQNLQDLYNILVSILLDDVKEGRKYWIGVDPPTYATKKDELKKAHAAGDVFLPMIQGQILKAPGISAETIELTQLIKSSIDGIRSLPAVSRGELPAKQISEETVKALMSSAAVSHGRKDIMINYALTEMAKVKFKIMTAMWDQPDWVRVTDATPGMPQYVAINLTITEKEYNQMLLMMSGLQLPPKNAPQDATAQFAQAFKAFKQKYENENDVHVEHQERWQYDKAPKGQDNIFSNEEFEGHVNSTGLTPTEFVEKYGAHRIPWNIYSINHLSDDVDIDIEYVVDFDVQKNKARTQAIAMKLSEMQKLADIDLFNDLDIEDAEGKVERAKEARQTIQIAERLEKDPKFAQAVQLADKIASSPELLEKVKADIESMQTQES